MISSIELSFFSPPQARLSYRLYFHYFSVNTNFSISIRKGMEIWTSPLYSNSILTLTFITLLLSHELCGHDRVSYNTPRCYILHTEVAFARWAVSPNFLENQIWGIFPLVDEKDKTREKEKPKWERPSLNEWKRCSGADHCGAGAAQQACSWSGT